MRLYYEGKFNRHVNDKELETLMKEDIENALRYGERTIDYDGKVIICEYDGIKVFVSTKNMGSIQTARPALHG